MEQKLKVVWLAPPMYPINHEFFNLLAEYLDLIVYQIGDHPKFRIDSNFFKDRNYKLRLVNKYTYKERKENSLLILKKLFQDKPDIVISTAFWIPSLYSAFSKKFIGYKFIITTDATNITEANIPFYKVWLRKFMCYFSDGLIAASKFTKRYLETLCRKKNVFLSTHTINVESWISEINSLPSNNIIRKELNLPINEILILGVGKYEKRKNWQAIFNLVKDIENCRLILIGSGELEEEYKKFIEYNRLNDKILLIGWKNPSELKKFYKIADIFIFPTLRDHFGFAVMEALSSGVPVICSNRAGASELIKNGYNGYVFDPLKDLNMLKTYVEQIMEKKSYFKSNALSTAKNFTLEKRVEEHINILKKIFWENK